MSRHSSRQYRFELKFDDCRGSGGSAPSRVGSTLRMHTISTYVVVGTQQSGRSMAEIGTTGTGRASKFVDRYGATRLNDCELRSDCRMDVQWACG